MSPVVELPEQELTAKFKRSTRFADYLWRKWAGENDWPGVLDLYEAAAFLRVDYKSIWRACQVGRSDHKARLRHQRIGSAYRIRRDDLVTLGRVEARAAA
jgi:hypothetical protein